MGSSTPLFREQGLQALRAGDADGAIELLSQTVTANELDSDARAYLGVAYSQKGLHQQARHALQRAVDLQPRSAHYRFNLGVAMERAGQKPAAVEAYRAALQIDPSHAQAQARLQALAPGSQEAHSSFPEWGRAPEVSATNPPLAPWLQARSPSAMDDLITEGSPPLPAPRMSAGEAFWRRLAAYLIDYVLISVVCGGAQLVILLMIGFAVGASGNNQALQDENLLAGVGIVTILLMFVLYLVVPAAYFVGMLAAWGQTVGKMALGIRVVGPDREKPSFVCAVLRELVGKFVSGFVFCLGYLWMLWDPEQQCWHDKIAGTFVERSTGRT
jgi:uncharacterized RDD family membrane protein YckC/Tfp pilus assembly protein PilF